MAGSHDWRPANRKAAHCSIHTLVRGHVYPALGLCSELVNRGHRVIYPTDVHFAAKVREAGATAIEFKEPGVRYAEKIVQFSTSDDYRPFVSVFGPMLIATAAAMVAELEGSFDFKSGSRGALRHYDA